SGCDRSRASFRKRRRPSTWPRMVAKRKGLERACGGYTSKMPPDEEFEFQLREHERGRERLHLAVGRAKQVRRRILSPQKRAAAQTRQPSRAPSELPQRPY